MTNNQLTKEWLQQTIAELESVRDEIPFGIDTNSELELAAFKMALAAMDSEPVILYRERNPYNGLTTGWQELTENELSFLKENAGENAEFLKLYRHAQPAPVVPDGYVMVPIEPTMSQELAGYKTLNDTGRMSRLMKTRLSNIYRAMLAAAPQEVKP